MKNISILYNMPRITWKDVMSNVYDYLENNKDEVMDSYVTASYNPTDKSKEFIKYVKGLKEKAGNVMENLEAFLDEWLSRELPSADFNPSVSEDTIHEVWVQYLKLDKMLALYFNCSHFSHVENNKFIPSIKQDFKKLPEQMGSFKQAHWGNLYSYLITEQGLNAIGKGKAIEIFNSKVKNLTDMREEVYISLKELKDAFKKYASY